MQFSKSTQTRRLPLESFGLAFPRGFDLARVKNVIRSTQNILWYVIRRFNVSKTNSSKGWCNPRYQKFVPKASQQSNVPSGAHQCQQWRDDGRRLRNWTLKRPFAHVFGTGRHLQPWSMDCMRVSVNKCERPLGRSGQRQLRESNLKLLFIFVGDVCKKILRNLKNRSIDQFN